MSIHYTLTNKLNILVSQIILISNWKCYIFKNYKFNLMRHSTIQTVNISWGLRFTHIGNKVFK